MDKQDLWPSAVVATALLFLVTAITIAAIARYSVDDALKIWTALTAIAGVITGAFVSYFFTRGTVKQAITQVSQAQNETNSARLDAQQSKAALLRVAGQMEPRQWRQLVGNDDVVRAAFANPLQPSSVEFELAKRANGTNGDQGRRSVRKGKAT
jgi:Zn-dependent protease with chaperone function